MAIIKNENKETIIKIFEYLKLKYNFCPDLKTMDIGTALIQKLNFFILIAVDFHVFII